MNNFDEPNFGKKSGDHIQSARKLSGQVYEFTSEQLALRVYFLSAKIMRIRYAVRGVFEKDFSYAIDPSLQPEHLETSLQEHDKYYRIKSSCISLKVSKLGFKLAFETPEGKVVNEDERGFHWEENNFGGNMVYCSKHLQNEECFYGMGDKPTDLNLHEKRITNWCTDTYGFEKDHDPIYRSIPFYFGLHESMAYGIFLDNSFKSTFDFAKEDAKIVSFWAEGGEMNYYFIFGPLLTEVAEGYTLLTGRPVLPPKWALGFHQCKWSYYPEAQVKQIAHEFRSRQIPCDAIYLDIDYMDGFRCFTWNKEHFPDPKRLITELKAEGFKTVVIIDPGIKVDPEYWVWQEGFEKDMFCRRSDGPLMTGNVWPGECHFPDFTSVAVREWWAGLFKDYYDLGIDGVWNDMNEPAVFGLGTFPDDVRHDHDGYPCSHRKAHNIYGMQMARASQQGFQKFKPHNRPFLITRASFAGFQRHACVWTGDNISTWDHLWLASTQIQRLSISGVSFCGSDVGGFIGEPDGELFTRWIQLACLHTFFRAHSSGDKGEKEPWVFGEMYEKIIRKFIEIRYKLLPYIYTNFYDYISMGKPMIRPLVFEDQKDPETRYRQDEFLVGPHLLVCPIVKESALGRWLYLPYGHWYNYFDHKIESGGMELYCDTGLEESPWYVRAGAVVPHYPIQQFIGEKVIETVKLQVYFDASSHEIISTYYEDSGEGFGYQNGEYRLATFTTKYNEVAPQYEIRQQLQGDGKVDIQNYMLECIGFPKHIKEIIIDGQAIKDWSPSKLLEAPANFTCIFVIF